MNRTGIFKVLIGTKVKFVLFVALHIMFYATLCVNAPFLIPLIIFSAVWSIGYLTAIRHFFLNPVDDFASKHVIYAQPNMYWVDFARRFVKNNLRIVVVSLFHITMAVMPIFLHRKLPIAVFGPILISNAVLPITYLVILKRQYSSWTQENK